jgi:hypothetical protein
MGGIFVRFDAWLTAVVLLAAMFLAWRVGWAWGRALRARGDDASLGKLDDATLALLGLLLAFSFSLALQKHDRRREMVVTDANGIGDFYTCASLIPEPVRSSLQKIIREYTERRLFLTQRRPDDKTLETELALAREMHNRMTELVGQAVDRGTPIAVPLTNTLNNLTSNHAARLAAFKDRLPTSIVGLLVVASLMTTVLVGRQQGQGASERTHLAGAAAFVALVTMVVYVILDLNQPSRGLIRVSQEPMQRVLATMAP